MKVLTERQVYILDKIKHMKLIRILIWPFMNIFRLYRLIFFRFSNHAKYIRKFKNKHYNKRCFIIGNGPSLNTEDLEKLKNEYCFACNRIYNIFDRTSWRPTYYMCFDPNIISIEIENIQKINLPYKFINISARKYCKGNKSNIHYFSSNGVFSIDRDNFKQKSISQDVSKYFSITHTVTCLSIEFAIYMGFKEIYLLGVDHNYSITKDSNGNIKKNKNVKDYFEGSKSLSITAQNIDATTLSYKVYRNYADKNGIKIYNATRGGKLEVFKRVDFDKLFKGD